MLREDVAVGDFLSEPDFDLALALRRVRGGQLFGRGALFGVLERGLGVGQLELERVPGRGRLGERGGELRFASSESLGRGRGACRPVLLGPFECPFGVAQLLRERIAGRSTLRRLSVCTALDAPRVGRPPSSSGTHAAAPLPERCLRVGQLLREDVAVGDFLSEPDFDLTLALRSLRGGQLFGRDALFGVLQRGLGVGQLEFERRAGSRSPRRASQRAPLRVE